MRRIDSGGKTRSPHSGHSKYSSRRTVYSFPLDESVQFLTTRLIESPPHVGQTHIFRPPNRDLDGSLRRDEEVEWSSLSWRINLPFVSIGSPSRFVD
jgi:hypothetical protein